LSPIQKIAEPIERALSVFHENGSVSASRQSLRRDPGAETLCDPLLYAGDFDNANFADRIAVLPLADQPATRWNYGHSTDVLGRVVEVASGQTLYQFEKQRLFDPLGMSDTAYYVAHKAKWPLIARGFPVDRSRVAGNNDPTLPRRWESGESGAKLFWQGLLMPILCRPARAQDLERADELVVASFNDFTQRHGFGAIATSLGSD
jgi:CubicO group peptidase (beta-lactamase class C family)